MNNNNLIDGITEEEYEKLYFEMVTLKREEAIINSRRTKLKNAEEYLEFYNHRRSYSAKLQSEVDLYRKQYEEAIKKYRNPERRRRLKFLIEVNDHGY